MDLLNLLCHLKKKSAKKNEKCLNVSEKACCFAKIFSDICFIYCPSEHHFKMQISLVFKVGKEKEIVSSISLSLQLLFSVELTRFVFLFQGL